MKENEKQAIEEMENDLRYCHTEFAGDFGDIYTDYHKTAEKLVVIGYRKQSEGEWIVDGGDLNRRAMCSNCKHEYAVQKGMLQLQNFSFCPNCGAKMRVQTEVKDYPPYLDRPKMKGGAE